jgi:hypothetical protein
MIDYQKRFWRFGVYQFVIIGSVLFVVMTVMAMVFYPGGTLTDPSAQGYSFFGNFFSELGFLETESRADNTLSAVLFIPALTLAGMVMVFFCLAFPQFFQETRSARILSWLGSICGVIAGLCFVGTAWTPGDINLTLHIEFVMWAFRLFPLAVFFFTIAIFQTRDYPRMYAWVFVVFDILLVVYILLLEFGPSAWETQAGQVIQAVGQKLIVYASIFSVMIQAGGALRRNVEKLD